MLIWDEDFPIPGIKWWNTGQVTINPPKPPWKERRAQGWKRSWWTSQFKTPAWRLGRLRLFLTVIIPFRLESLSFDNDVFLLPKG